MGCRLLRTIIIITIVAPSSLMVLAVRAAAAAALALLPPARPASARASSAAAAAAAAGTAALLAAAPAASPPGGRGTRRGGAIGRRRAPTPPPPPHCSPRRRRRVPSPPPHSSSSSSSSGGGFVAGRSFPGSARGGTPAAAAAATTTKVFSSSTSSKGSSAAAAADGDDDDDDGESRTAPTGGEKAVAEREAGAHGTTTAFVRERVRETLQEEILPGILPGGDGSAASDAGGGGASAVATLLVVGVSGGCDSVALLHLLRDAVAGAENQKPRRGEWRILAAHFDHRRRGADSDGDREFVRELCRRLDVPLRCFYWGDRQRGRDGDDGDDGVVFTQERARQWRRSTMVRLLREEMTTLPDGSEKEGHRHQQQQAVRRVGLLVTAHHKDDSDETLLLKVLRGVHVTNVAGMKAFSAAVGEEETTTREESTGGNHPPLLFWARPLIHVRKSDLQQYLLENNYAWREDDSNLSGKYLRNRVRNELIPLLEDMVGGRDSLQRRLTNVEQQCQELRQDLNGRVETYLTDHVVDDGSLFLLPTTTDAPAEKFDLVVKEALHQWVVEQSDCYQFTYDQLQRVCSQIMNHEDRRQWRMNIGGGWDIQREGDSLRLVLEKIDQDEENHVVSSNNKVRELDWYLVDKSFNTEDTTASSGLLLLHVPRHYMLPRSIRFLYSTNDNSKLSITPPWRRRKGSSSRPIRVPEFLRGQKVPLHKRRDTPTITLQHGDDGAVSLVAVYVSTRNEWIVDEEFSFQEGEFSDEERDRVILEIG